MKSRVLMLTQEVNPIPPQKGAAVEQWIDAVAHRLSRYEPHVLSVPHPDRPDDEVVHGVHYHRIRIGRLYKRLFRKLTRLDPYSYADRIVRYAHSVKPALLHIHNAPQLVDAFASGLPGVRIILHMHNEKRDKVRTRVDAMVGCSAYIRDWGVEHGIAARRFAVLDNGVDLSAHVGVRSAQRTGEVRRRYGVPTDRFIVLYAGRISPEKGPDLLVKAMRRLDVQRFHLVLLGEWPKGDAAVNERVRFARALRTQLQDVPHTVIDVVPPQDMPGMYALGDLLVIPSRFEEPFSMVAIEGMSAEVPVMALKKGGMAEYMTDGKTALLLSRDATAAQLGDAITSAADAPDRLADVVRGARNLVEQRFGWGRVAARTEQLYDEVLAAT